jgi:hypothetical protein
MNVTSVTDPSSLYATSALSSASSASTATQVGAAFDAGQPPGVSKMGSLMSELKELQQSDPDKFKKVMGDIADKLKAEASDATGAKADRLNAMADKFTEAAQTGDLPALKPPAHGGHHRGGHAAYAAAQAQPPPGDQLAQVIQSALDDSSV